MGDFNCKVLYDSKQHPVSWIYSDSNITVLINSAYWKDKQYDRFVYSNVENIVIDICLHKSGLSSRYIIPLKSSEDKWTYSILDSQMCHVIDQYALSNASTYMVNEYQLIGIGNAQITSINESNLFFEKTNKFLKPKLISRNNNQYQLKYTGL